MCIDTTTGMAVKILKTLFEGTLRHEVLDDV